MNKPRTFAGLVLLVLLVVAGLALANATMSQYLTALISVAALCVSLVSSFKEDLFPYRPQALFDEVILAPMSGASGDSPALIVPIAFVNEGHGSGVIQGLTLRVESTSAVKVYTPVAEVDLQKFISEKRTLHALNLLGAFNLLTLGSRASAKKAIVFMQEPSSSRYPFSPWASESYTFRLFFKHSDAAEPMEVGCVIHEISAQLLANYKAGAGTSLSPSRELYV